MSRAAAGQAANAARVAGGMGSQLFGEGQQIQGNLVPQLNRWMTGQHEMSPDQINELLTAAGAGAGGATSGFTGQAELESARTRNTAGFQSALDAAQRGRQQSLAKASEGVAAEDVQGALGRQKYAAGELGSLGMGDINSALAAMGIQQKDIATEVEAGKSGWFQNLTGFMDSLAKVTSAFKGGQGSNG